MISRLVLSVECNDGSFIFIEHRTVSKHFTNVRSMYISNKYTLEIGSMKWSSIGGAISRENI